MKKIFVKKLSDTLNVKPKEVDGLLSGICSEWNLIQTVNWPEYPYCPNVGFRIGYTDDSILLQYKVKEQTVLALCGHDNEDVWTDSCVEFFLMPDGADIYYNIETNCIGSALIGCGQNRSDRQRGDESIVSQIKRYSTLGTDTFAEKPFDEEWSVSLVIPFTAFFKSNIDSLEGKTLKANFYKCGDHLSIPYFLSWNPIKTEQPNFHQPNYFGELEFIK